MHVKNRSSEVQHRRAQIDVQSALWMVLFMWRRLTVLRVTGLGDEHVARNRERCEDPAGFEADGETKFPTEPL